MAAETRGFGSPTSRIRRGQDTRAATYGRFPNPAYAAQPPRQRSEPEWPDQDWDGADDPQYDDDRDAHAHARGGYDADAYDHGPEPETWQGYEAEQWQEPQPELSPMAQKVQKLINGAGAATSLLLILGLCFWGYKLAVRDVTGVPVLRALEGPSRVAPEDPGGQLAEHTGLSVNSVAATGTASATPDRLTLAPQPEALGDGDLPMAEMEGGSNGPLVARGTVAQIDQVALRGRSVKEPLPEEAAEPILDAPTVAGIEGAVAMAIQTIPTTVPGVSMSIRPKMKPGMMQAVMPVEVPKARVVDATSLRAGTRLVQLGAFETEAAARAEWDRLAVTYGAHFTGKGQIVQAAESAGRSFFRLRAEGFETDADTRGFCAALSQDLQCVPVTLR